MEKTSLHLLCQTDRFLERSFNHKHCINILWLNNFPLYISPCILIIVKMLSYKRQLTIGLCCDLYDDNPNFLKLFTRAAGHWGKKDSSHKYITAGWLKNCCNGSHEGSLQQILSHADILCMLRFTVSFIAVASLKFCMWLHSIHKCSKHFLENTSLALKRLHSKAWSCPCSGKFANCSACLIDCKRNFHSNMVSAVQETNCKEQAETLSYNIE